MNVDFYVVIIILLVVNNSFEGFINVFLNLVKMKDFLYVNRVSKELNIIFING